MNVLDIVAVVAIVGFVITRQIVGEPLRGRRLIVLPIILTVIGASELFGHGHHATHADIALICVSAIVAAVIGVGQGAMMHLEARAGVLFARMPLRSLWLWVALVLSRVVIDVIGSGMGAHLAASTTPILMILGINRLAQAAVVGPRAIGAGIPFSPERNGSTMLGGMFDTATAAGTGAGYSPQGPTPADAPRSDSQSCAAEWQSGVRVIAGRLSATAQQR
jgi:hypothetical protein